MRCGAAHEQVSHSDSRDSSASCSRSCISAWSEQCLEFAAYLFLIELFPKTLIPASTLGLTMTSGSLLLSSTLGGMVDRREKLGFARQLIVAQKVRLTSQRR